MFIVDKSNWAHKKPYSNGSRKKEQLKRIERNKKKINTEIEIADKTLIKCYCLLNCFRDSIQLRGIPWMWLNIFICQLQVTLTFDCIVMKHVHILSNFYEQQFIWIIPLSVNWCENCVILDVSDNFSKLFVD